MVLLHPIGETERSRFAARAKRNAEHETEVREANPLVRNRIHIHVLAYGLDQPLLKAFVAHLKAVDEKEPEPVSRPHCAAEAFARAVGAISAHSLTCLMCRFVLYCVVP